jgi:uncharacterized repeat protein (TIGR01451 family)/fimbrial isopeptide formation D2 family protein
MGSMLIVSGTLLGAITPSVAASTAGSTGYEAPTASVSPNEWTAPDNAFADDGVFATATGVDNDDQGYDGFGFSIPTGSIIEGFEVQVEASSTDATGCQITVALSDDNGAGFSSNAAAQNLTDVSAVLTFGSDSSTFGEVWDPTQLEGSAFRLRVRMNDGGGCDDAAVVSIDSVAVNVHYRTIDESTVAHPTLPGDLCEAADFNFIIDMSGSIGAQGSFPSNLPDLKAGVIGFVQAFEGQGDGLYSGSRFNGTTASDLTNGYVAAGDTSTPGTFIDAVDALSSPSGTTPTAAGIANGLDNDANDRAGVPNIMFVVTDGSPNVPPGGDLSDPAVWVQAADAAIAAADDARVAGYRVYAVYVRTDNDPGDTTLPFSNPAGDAEWASTVMDRIGRGLVIDADFETLADDLIDEFGCRPQVTIEKTADQGPFNAGDEIGFTVTLTNEGDPAEGVVVTDHLPAGIVWAEDPDNPNWAIVAHDGHQDLTWIGGNLGKVSSSVHVSGITDAADCGVVENTASFTTTNDGQGSATAELTVRCPDLVISKTPDNGFVSAGDDATFGITVTNNGPGTAYNVDIDDTLPAGLSWTDDKAECTITGGVLHCDIASLGDDASFTVNVTATTSPAACAVMPNTATADADNNGQVSDPGQITCQNPLLTIAKTPNNGFISAGDDAVFEITVTNHGPGVARDVDLDDTLPAGLSWSEVDNLAECSISNGVLHCDVGDLGDDESFSVSVKATTTVQTCAALPNTATADADNHGQVSDPGLITCQLPDLVISKTPDNGFVSAGDDATFGITVTNNGPGTAYNVDIDDTLPAGLSWTDDKAECTITGGVLHCDIASLGDDASFTVNVTATTSPAACAVMPNTATADADNNGQVSDPGQITCRLPNIEVEKTADEGPFSAGDQIGFSVTIHNLGPGTAYDAEASDTLPGSGWSIDGPANGWSLDANVLSFGGDDEDEADLANGGSATVHVVRDSVFADCGIVDNTVEGWAANDPNATVEDPETASAELTVDCPILGITKTPEHGEPVVAGNPIGFWVEIANTGDGDAYNVAVEDELPAGFEWSIVAAQSDDGWAIDDGTLVWTDEGPGTLPAHSTSTVLVRADTDPQDCENVTNTAVLAQGIVIIGIPFPPNTVIGEDSATEQLRCPVIGIDKDVEEGGADAEVGEEVEFTIELAVTEGPVTSVVLTDVLPEGQTYVDGSQASDPAADQFDPPTVNPDGTTTLVWRWDSLDDGDPAATVTYRVTIDAGFGGEALENAAEVCVAEIETCEEDLAVVNVGSRYDVSLEKSNDAPAGELDEPTVENGDSITYTLDYTVFIDGLETDVILVDLLPEGVTYVDGSATTDALFASVTFYPDMADPLTDTNDVSGALVWTGTPASDADVSGSLAYQVTADEDDEATEDVDEGGAAQAQPLVNEAEICLADVGEDGEIDGEPFVCDDAASEVFVNEPPLALTPPPTDTIADRGPAVSGSNLPMILVLFGGVMLLASVLIPAPAATRPRRDR